MKNISDIPKTPHAAPWTETWKNLEQSQSRQRHSRDTNWTELKIMIIPKHLCIYLFVCDYDKDDVMAYQIKRELNFLRPYCK